MKNVKISKIILAVITVLLLLSIAMDVKADDSVLLQTGNNNTANNTNNNTTNNNAANNNTSVPTVNTSNKANTNSYVNNSNSLPKTGAEDYTTVFIIIGVCVISAVYAYRKVNDYNGIK